jgi:hypothetical protein
MTHFLLRLKSDATCGIFLPLVVEHPTVSPLPFAEGGGVVILGAAQTNQEAGECGVVHPVAQSGNRDPMWSAGAKGNGG